MDPLITDLAAQWSTAFGGAARDVAADELLDAIEGARCHNAACIEWIESPMWDVLCTVVGDGSRAAELRVAVFAEILGRGFLPSVEEALFDGARVLAAWLSAGESITATAAELRVSRPTARVWVRHALAGTTPNRVGRPRAREAA